MHNFAQFDIVKAPYPFTEPPFIKRRPAVVLSEASAFQFAEGVLKNGRLSVVDMKNLKLNLMKLFGGDIQRA